MTQPPSAGAAISARLLIASLKPSVAPRLSAGEPFDSSAAIVGSMQAEPAPHTTSTPTKNQSSCANPSSAYATTFSARPICATAASPSRRVTGPTTTISISPPTTPVPAISQLACSGPKLSARRTYSANTEKKYVTAKMNRKWRTIKLRIAGREKTTFAAARRSSRLVGWVALDARQKPQRETDVEHLDRRRNDERHPEAEADEEPAGDRPEHDAEPEHRAEYRVGRDRDTARP